MTITIDKQEYELVHFIPDSDHPEQKGCYLIRPVRQLDKLTKAELIKIIEENK